MVTIYIGSLWHKHGDPFVTVVGFIENDVAVKLASLADAAYDALVNDDCFCDAEVCTCEIEDDICWGDTSAETGETFLEYFVPTGNKAGYKMLKELIRTGIFVC